MRNNKSSLNVKVENPDKEKLKDKIDDLKQKNLVLIKEIYCLKHELARNNEKLKLKIRNTKNNIELLNHQVDAIKSSKFIKIWEKITKLGS